MQSRHASWIVCADLKNLCHLLDFLQNMCYPMTSEEYKALSVKEFTEAAKVYHSKIAVSLLWETGDFHNH